MTVTHTTRPASSDEIAAEMDRRGAVIETLERERNEAVAYLKAFVFATIDPEDKRADVQVHQANPSLGWYFTLNDTGIPGHREILGSQVRRAMEIVGFDKLKIEPAGTTVADDHIAADLRALRAEARATALELALKPFAEEAGNWHDDVPDDYRSLCTEPGSETAHPGSETVFTIGDLRRARDLIKTEGAR